MKCQQIPPHFYCTLHNTTTHSGKFGSINNTKESGSQAFFVWQSTNVFDSWGTDHWNIFSGCITSLKVRITTGFQVKTAGHKSIWCCCLHWFLSPYGSEHGSGTFSQCYPQKPTVSRWYSNFWGQPSHRWFQPPKHYEKRCPWGWCR